MAEADETQTVLIAEPGILALGDYRADGQWPSYFTGETVKQVACGSFHSAVVCASGQVWIFGFNLDEQDTDSDTRFELRRVASLDSVRITQVACGEQFDMFLTNKGELYTRGVNNFYGQLGLGHTEKSLTPVLVTGLPPIKKVASGAYHTVALADSGEVWVAGYNYYGQLGVGHKTDQTSFILVPNISEPILDISCGYWHTALLSVSHVLLMTGRGDSGQLGLGATDYVSNFHPASTPSSAVAAVSCGGSHTVTLRADGSVWSFGGNLSGQLGTGDTAHRTNPTRMIGLETYSITEVVAGWRHTALLTQQGDVLVCGLGESGELGQAKKDVLAATLLCKSPGLIVKQVAFAQTYSLALIEPKLNTSLPAQPESQDTVQEYLGRGCITALERSIMQSLECPVCCKVMCPPIPQCMNGHSLCNTCRSHSSTTVCPMCKQGFISARSLALESLCGDIQLPCTDCLLRMPVCDLESHAAICPRREYSCPLERSCGWSGRPDAMLAHTSSAHSDQTWRDLPHLFLHSTSDNVTRTDVLAAHNQLFTLHRRFSQATGEFQAVVRFIGPPEDKDNFKFKFTLFADNKEISFRNNLCPDIESVEDNFQSSSCVLMKRECVDSFLQHGRLVCQATITNVEVIAVADRIKALLSA